MLQQCQALLSHEFEFGRLSLLFGHRCSRRGLVFGLPENQHPLCTRLTAHAWPCPLSTIGSTQGSGLWQDCMGALKGTVENKIVIQIPGVLSSFTCTLTDWHWFVTLEASQVKSECSLPQHTQKEAAFFSLFFKFTFYLGNIGL